MSTMQKVVTSYKARKLQATKLHYQASTQDTHSVPLCVGGLDKAGCTQACILSITESLIVDTVGAGRGIQAGVALATVAAACNGTYVKAVDDCDAAIHKLVRARWGYKMAIPKQSQSDRCTVKATRLALTWV
jgi:hypothetical protein